jgi:hypothetical protein
VPPPPLPPCCCCSCQSPPLREGEDDTVAQRVVEGVEVMVALAQGSGERDTESVGEGEWWGERVEECV